MVSGKIIFTMIEWIQKSSFWKLSPLRKWLSIRRWLKYNTCLEPKVLRKSMMLVNHLIIVLLVKRPDLRKAIPNHPWRPINNRNRTTLNKQMKSTWCFWTQSKQNLLCLTNYNNKNNSNWIFECWRCIPFFWAYIKVKSGKSKRNWCTWNCADKAKYNRNGVNKNSTHNNQKVKR